MKDLEQLMSAVTVFFIFVAIITIAAIAFGGWVIVSIVRVLASAVTTLFAPNRHDAAAKQLNRVDGLSGVATEAVRCGNSGCMAQNPADAKFCRRCGRGLPAAARVQVRRAAVW
jgi:hypothetical protein